MMMKRMLALAVVAAAAVAGGLAAGHWFRGTADDGVAVAAPAAHGTPVEQLWA
ncbi:TlpA family protein disulfide reductase, partial [Burkholderia contaminans]